MQEIQRRLKDDILDEQDVREVVWEHLKPTERELTEIAEENGGVFHTDDEYASLEEQFELDGVKNHPIVKELTRAAYGLLDFDAAGFREQLKTIGIYHGYA